MDRERHTEKGPKSNLSRVAGEKITPQQNLQIIVVRERDEARAYGEVPYERHNVKSDMKSPPSPLPPPRFISLGVAFRTFGSTATSLTS